MTSLRRSAIAPVLLGLCVTSAEADPITLGFTFTATNFPFSSIVSPVDPVVGSFSVTFDNAHDIFDEPAGLVVMINAPVTGVFAFHSFPASDELWLGALVRADDRVNLLFRPYDFVLRIAGASTPRPSAEFRHLYEVVGQGVVGSVADDVALSPVPEPASLTLVGLGLLGIGLGCWLHARAPRSAEGSF